MPDLHLIGVHEDGKHVLLADRDGAQFRLAINDALRSVLRREYVDHSAAAEPLRPTEVQAMIRAGATASEAAQRAGWPVEKVHRYEGPILAERAHIAQLAGRAHVRVAPGALHPVTLRERIEERLEQRDVVLDDVDWDSWRSEDGQWTVEVTFPAGGRRRTASWHFSRSSMTVNPIDDESRWLSEDAGAGTSASAASAQSAGTAGASGPATPGSASVRAHTDRPAPTPLGSHSADAPGQAPRTAHHDPDNDLTAGLRERAAARGRRRPRRLPTGTPLTTRPGAPTGRRDPGGTQPPWPTATRPVTARPEASRPEAGRAATPQAEATGPALPTDIPSAGVAPDPDAVPLAPFDYDPATDGPPPGAHSDPQADGLDGRPEPAATQGGDSLVAPATPADAEGVAATEAAEAAESEAAPAPGAARAPHGRSVASAGVEEPELPLGTSEPEASALLESPGSTPLEASDSVPAEASDSVPADEPDSAAGSTAASASEAGEAAESGEPRGTRAGGPATAKPTRRQQQPRSARTANRTNRPAQATATAQPDSPAKKRAATKPGPVAKPGVTTTPEREAPEQNADAAQESSSPSAAGSSRKGGSARRGRASVPAWDDIMFGAKPPSS